jgi:rhodanese-related sulfurtransferase
MGTPDAKLPSISAEEAWNRLAQDSPEAVLIDVRESFEYRWRHINGARNIPLSQFKRRIDEVPRDKEVLLLCLSGHRSITAGKMLQKRGVSQVVNIKGGVFGWLWKKLPMVHLFNA